MKSLEFQAEAVPTLWPLATGATEPNEAIVSRVVYDAHQWGTQQGPK